MNCVYTSNKLDIENIQKGNNVDNLEKEKIHKSMESFAIVSNN